MKIDQSKVTRTNSLFGDTEGISFPDCPRFRAEAEKIVAMLLKIPPFDYHSVSGFQKRVIAEYWRYYDALDTVLAQPITGSRFVTFREWLAQETTTPPENIRRACQWLVETGVIALKPAVREKALERAEDIREAVPQGRKE